MAFTSVKKIASGNGMASFKMDLSRVGDHIIIKAPSEELHGMVLIDSQIHGNTFSAVSATVSVRPNSDNPKGHAVIRLLNSSGAVVATESNQLSNNLTFSLRAAATSVETADGDGSKSWDVGLDLSGGSIEVSVSGRLTATLFEVTYESGGFGGGGGGGVEGA